MNKQHLKDHYMVHLHKAMINDFSLTEHQIAQLEIYGNLLCEWNEKFNLTAIVDPDKIETHHFYDSCAITKYIDFTTVQVTADVGTGGGFPGIPLKILFPHLTMILIEVNNKKRMFLEHIISRLDLKNVILYPYDWRTFLRSTHYAVDYFFARASLQPEELIRIFKPSCVYRNAQLVYWASEQWKAGKQESVFIEKEESYALSAELTRKYIFFKKSNE